MPKKILFDFTNSYVMNKIKKILITGASSSIGLKTIQAFQETNAQTHFVCTTRDSVRLHQLLVDNSLESSHVTIAECDLGDYRRASDVLIPVLDNLECIETVVNIAGMYISKPFLDCMENDFDMLVSSNLKTTYVATHISLPYLLKNKGGSIVNISSTLAVRTISGANNVIYDATKAAVIKFSQSLAKEMGPNNIRVNCICPGVLSDNLHVNDNMCMMELLNDQPIKRFGQAIEIADAIVFLSNEKSKWITGNVMMINGGINL